MEKHNIPQAKQPYGCHTIHWEYNKIIQLVVLEIKQQVVRDRILVYIHDPTQNEAPQGGVKVPKEGRYLKEFIITHEN